MNRTPLRLAIVGAAGRMGQRLMALADRDARFDVTVRVDQGDVLDDLVVDQVDCIIDFSVATQAPLTAQYAAQKGLPLILGTTGLSEEDRAVVDEAATHVPLIAAPNYAVGVNALFALAGELANLVGDGWDLEVVEAHHRHKVDAPSGTARRLVELLAAARGTTYEAAAQLMREGVEGPREEGEIGVGVIRGGDVVGTHEVLYLGQGEEIRLSHRATDRDIFARGALRAAHWLAGEGSRAPGLYGMGDVLRLS